MSKPPKLSLASIVAAAVPPSSKTSAEIVQLSPSTNHNGMASRGTLKERAKQLSVYLEPPVYDQLRDIAYAERTKIHQLMLESLDLLFKARGALGIHQLNQQQQR